MERRLRNSPLAQPESVLARQQPVAEHQTQFVVERALVIVARVVLQDVANVIRVVQEVTAPRGDLEVDDVAEPRCSFREDADGIASDGRKHAQDRHSSRSRRQRVLRAHVLIMLLSPAILVSTNSAEVLL